MGDQFDFSLLIGSQYDGGPMEWDEQTLYVSTGTILNHVDINKVRTDRPWTIGFQRFFIIDILL